MVKHQSQFTPSLEVNWGHRVNGDSTVSVMFWMLFYDFAKESSDSEDGLGNVSGML